MFTQKKVALLGLLILMATAAMLAACVPAQPVSGQAVTAAQQVATDTTPRQITVVGYGEAFGEPDRAQVQVGVETFSPTVGEATTANETTLSAVMDALTAAGIAEADIQTTNYSVWAEQIYGDKGPEGIAGYRVSNMVNVTVRDIALVDDVLGAVTDAGANAIYGVTFSVADTAALQSEARAKAVADAEARAQSLAELNGVELGEPILITETIGQPFPMPMGGANFAVAEQASAPGISPGQLSVQMPVQITYAIK